MKTQSKGLNGINDDVSNGIDLEGPIESAHPKAPEEDHNDWISVLPVANDNIDEGVYPSSNGINDDVLEEVHNDWISVLPLANDYIDEGVNPSSNGINDDDLNGIDLEGPIESALPKAPEVDYSDWLNVNRKPDQRRHHLAVQARRAKYPARDAINLFEPRKFGKFKSLAEASEVARMLVTSLRSSREPTPTSPTSSFKSVPETFDSNENTPQSGNSHSELTPEVAMYCGALQFE